MRRRVHVEEETGELNIIPYLDVVVNLVMFMLLSITGLVAFGILEVSAPKIAGAAEASAAQQDGPKLLLTVAIGRDGFYVAGAGGVLGQDAPAPDANRPPTIAKKADGSYDYAALTGALLKIKAQYRDEKNLILSADTDVLYDVVIQTMDACRVVKVQGSDGSPRFDELFPAISLSLIG
jgi:biopolymer transport protein TolR